MGHFHCLVIGEHTYQDLLPWVEEHQIGKDEEGHPICVTGEYAKVEYFEKTKGFFKYLPGAKLRYTHVDDPFRYRYFLIRMLQYLIPHLVERVGVEDQSRLLSAHEGGETILTAFSPYNQIEIGHLDIDALDQFTKDEAAENFDFAERFLPEDVQGYFKRAFHIREDETKEHYVARQHWAPYAILDLAQPQDSAWVELDSFKETYPGNATWNLWVWSYLRVLQVLKPDEVVTLYHCSQ